MTQIYMIYMIFLLVLTDSVAFDNQTQLYTVYTVYGVGFMGLCVNIKR